jgi:hypothetical protein
LHLGSITRDLEAFWQDQAVVTPLPRGLRMDTAARSRWKRRLAWAAGALAVYALAGFVLLPWWARGWLERSLGKEYAREVTIERLAFNPFTFRARAENVALGNGRGGRQFEAARIEADYELRSFFSKARYVAELVLDRPKLALARGADGKFDLPRAQTPPPLGPQSPLLLRLGRLNLIDGALTYTDAGLDGARIVLADLDVGADALDTQQEAEPGTFQLTVRESGGATFEIAGRVHPGTEAVVADVTLDGLGTELLRPFVAVAIPAHVAEFGASARMHYVRNAAHPDGVLSAIAAEVAPLALALAPAADADPPVRLTRIALSGGTLDLGAYRFDAESLRVEGGTLRVVRAADGTIDLERLFAAPAAAVAPVPDASPAPPDEGGDAVPSATQASTETPSPAETLPVAPAEPPAAKRTWQWRIARVEVADIALGVRDDGTTPPVELPLTFKSVSLAPVASEAGASSTLTLALGIGEAGELTAAGDVVRDTGAATLEVAAKAIALDPAQPYLARVAKLILRGGTLGAEGKLALTPDGEPRVHFTGRLQVRAFATVDAARKRDFLNWKALDVRGLDLALAPDRVRIDRILADGLYARVIVAADRTTNIGDIVIAGDAAPADAAPPDVGIGRVELKRSRLRFADLSLTPRFITTIESLGGSITGLSSKAGARATVDLAGQVDAYAPATVKGELNPFRGAENTDIALTFRNVELNSLTPYSGKFAGYAIDRGKLNLDLRYEVKDNLLDGQNKVVLDQLTLGAKVDSPDALSLPLTLAIALLKDGNGVIDLDIPVYGDLNDPKFRLGGVIWKAVLSLLTKIVTAPFALIGALVGGGPDDDSLSRIAFEFGGVAPREAEVPKFEKLRKALLARPQLTLSIRGIADPLADGRALAETALRGELATRWAAGRDEDDPELPPPEAERELLLALHAERLGPPPEPPADPEHGGDEAARAQAASDHEAAETEWLLGVREALRDSFEVDEAALARLADARASAVRDGLLASGELPPEQVFLARSELAATGTDKDGITLKLELGAR